MARDAIDELVDAQLAKQPRLTFNCHKCGPVTLTPCNDPYPQCPKRFTVLHRKEKTQCSPRSSDSTPLSAP